MNRRLRCAAFRSRPVRRAKPTATLSERKLPAKMEASRFDRLVARYYPAVYSFASRFTDDHRQAVVLTREAFKSVRQQLGTHRRSETALAAILLCSVIRIGLAAA